MASHGVIAPVSSVGRRSTLSERDRYMEDPFAAFLAPPEGETPQEAEERTKREKAAQKVSEEIDRELRQEFQSARRKKCVKILLLGQSESGKSTVLKNFQKKYDPSAFNRERQVWRSVCQLNVVRSFGIILDVLNRHGNLMSGYPPTQQQLTPPTSPADDTTSPQTNFAYGFPTSPTGTQTTPTNETSEDSPITPASSVTSPIHVPNDVLPLPPIPPMPPGMMGGGMLTDEHRRTIMRLSPLRQIEQVLTQKFKPLPMGNGPHVSGPSSTRPGSTHVGSSGLAPSRSLQELHVNGYAWQRARARSRLTKENHKLKAKGQDAVVDQTEDNEIASGGWEDENLEKVLYACKDDMVKLWQDPVVRAILKEYRIGLEELSNYFLDEIHRIAIPNYTPTDDDILRARLKTVGVTEHRFTVKPRMLDPDNLGGAELRIYDVGGARSQRPTWMPYFDDVNAIVFLAPMSAFDQTLAEARDVNRLEDTFVLWRDICSAKLLAKVSIVLLLNKRDLLEKKLETARFERYVKSYSGANRWENVAKYLRSKFRAIHRELSPEKRLFYAHVTCATDVKQMVVILAAIEDLVLRRNLEEVNLL